MVTELDLRLDDGRTLHAYDTGGADRLAVFWHHGTPNIGAPPAPLFAAADRLGLRWVSHDRPGYGGSTPRAGRDIASAAGDVAAVADALGIDRFAVAGHSGGGPHALACGALLPDRVLAVVSGAGMAPYDAAGLDWFAGMVPSGVASLRAAAAGREAKERFETSGAEYDPGFTPADLAALSGEWSWFSDVVGPATEAGPGGLIDDDLAYVSPWGFDPTRIAPPVLLLHGGRDGVVPATHSEWLARHCPDVQLRRYPEDGHISVLTHAEAALEWLRERATGRR
ncbi:alpha/beta hydrolase [Micromonospora sp. RTP1Z1]|uniref:alpha/beta fold hydrolase n=1 Tax=Micromonospora sp. RTP1Z1 TaxID=2994043 RepID=UPI0029C91419|nr:alpha/beta hydrolase [Micromonospora sp. RTP1Z1]